VGIDNSLVFDNSLILIFLIFMKNAPIGAGLGWTAKGGRQRHNCYGLRLAFTILSATVFPNFRHSSIHACMHRLRQRSSHL